jgi:hypothetical protein
MAKYILEKSEKSNFWCCTDTENLIFCLFENKNFNDNQKFELLEDSTINVVEIAKKINDMSDWLFKNHYDKLF